MWIYPESLRPFLYPPYSHLLIIFAVFFVTYCRILGKDYFWCIDDIDGVARFSEQWIGEHEEERMVNGVKTKVLVAERKVDSYEIGEGAKKKSVKFLSFIPELGFPGCAVRFLRLNIGKKFCVIGKNKKGHDIYGYRQSPIRHHILSLVAHYGNIILGYIFLRHYLGPNIAFGACLLYSVHPLTAQLVGWISGINYTLSMIFSLAAIDLCIYVHDYRVLIPLVILTSFISSVTVMIGCFTGCLLLFLGFKWAALAAGIVGAFVLLWKGRETKDYRVSAFKEQNMDHTTFLNWRKPIVMIKTLWYYFPMVFFPIRMGLYHIWGYFYEDPIERIDWMFFAGLGVLSAGVLAWYHAGFGIQLGLLWFVCFWCIFSNFITAQQFVADRYAAVPCFGICLILSILLYGTPIFWVLLGLYAMRTFLFLPTFKNEIDYYLSNFHNFRKSEVSLGNLGVAYMNQGMTGSAVDTWMLSTKINPHYDVSFYNLYSIFKANGRNEEALAFLKQCLNAKIVHFKERWEKEYAEFGLQIEYSKNPAAKTVDSLFAEAKIYFDSGNILKEQETLAKILAMPTNAILPNMFFGMNERYKYLVAGGT